ncbi:MAG TPA: LysE family translocator [Pyrinomonadaceae bacterium]|nr:LysE family translocator [Pyrinomonadaceae bacterium]
MPLDLWLSFVAMSASLISIPGPTILTVISHSVKGGRRSYVPLVAAVALGDLTALVMSFLGLGLLGASKFGLTVITFASGLYLLCLGLKRLLSDTMSAILLDAPPIRRSRWQLFASTYTITASNPKSIAFFVLFLQQFITQSASVTQQRSILSATWVALSVIIITLYVVSAASAHRLLASPRAQHTLKTVGGLVLSAAGVWAIVLSLL